MTTALTEDQRAFLLLFVSDGEYSAEKAAAQLGLRPSVVRSWLINAEFQKQVRKAQRNKLAARGYNWLRTVEDTLAIAHSDIGEVILSDESGLADLPRHVRVAIKSVENGVGIRQDGSTFIFAKKIVFHDKAWALQKAAEWQKVAESMHSGDVGQDDTVRRVAGLVVRPPITEDEAEVEEMLK